VGSTSYSELQLVQATRMRLPRAAPALWRRRGPAC
jgi:hypothetical protein